LFRAFAISDSVTVFRIVSGIGKGSSFVMVAGIEAGVGSSVVFFLPNRISCMRSWNGAPEPFPRNRSMPLVIFRARRVWDYYRFSRARMIVCYSRFLA